MAKSWADMSKEERSKYDSKKAYNKSTGQGKHAAKSSGGGNSGGSSGGGVKHYQATLNPTSQAMLDRQNQKKAQDAKKAEARERASAYLAKGNSRDAEFDRILKEGGSNNADFQKSVNANRKQKYEANKQARKDEARAYQEYTRSKSDARKQSGRTAERKVDQSAHYKHMMDTEGSYGGDRAHQEAVKQLMSTGQKFSALDVQREMGSASTHNMNGLYKSYGGYENYKENHSVGSGNFRGDDSLGTMKQADDAQRKYFQDRTNYYNSDSFNEKYGSYDWAQKDKQRINEQSQKFNDSFDAREKRMKKSGYGSVYGY